MVPPLFRGLIIVLALVTGILVLVGAWHLLAEARGERTRGGGRRDGSSHAATLLERTGWVPARLAESSGIAVSQAHPGVLWSHNDAGDEPVIYAIDLTGRPLARFRVRGAVAVDWEDLARGPCPGAASGDGDCLYIGDIGDNEARRRAVTLYVVPEPDAASVSASGASEAVAIRAVTFRYPDGAHDAEALAVTPEGAVLIVTKGRTGPIQLFEIGREAIARPTGRTDTVTAQFRGTLPIQPDARIGRYVTGAAFSPSGATLAVRTYTELFFFTRATDGRYGPVGSPCFLGTARGLAEPQGEAVDYLDDETLVITSEAGRGVPGPIHRVRCG